MKTQRQLVTAAAGKHFECLPIAADEFSRDGLLRSGLGTHGQLILHARIAQPPSAVVLVGDETILP